MGAGTSVHICHWQEQLGRSTLGWMPVSVVSEPWNYWFPPQQSGFWLRLEARKVTFSVLLWTVEVAFPSWLCLIHALGIDQPPACSLPEGQKGELCRLALGLWSVCCMHSGSADAHGTSLSNCQVNGLSTWEGSHSHCTSWFSALFIQMIMLRKW